MARSIIKSPISYKTNVKRIVVNALRSVFDADYPDTTGVLKNIFISIDWPDKPEQYPMMLVSFQENKMGSAGIGHFEHIQGGPNIYKRWLYEGTIQILIIAESSLQRDYISDHLVHMLAFGQTDINTYLFVPYIEQNLGVDVQILKDTLQPHGESVEQGVDWGLTDMTLYMTGYTFNVVGSFTSGVVTNGYIRGVNEAAEII
jgi:hypothetical protein